MSRFVPGSRGDIAALIAAYPFAWIVSPGSDGLLSSTVPLLAEMDGAGDVVALFGHFALANPQVAALQVAPGATVLFTGPQAYVSPRLVSRPDWAPTWNFATVRCDGRVRFVPEENDAALERLAAHLERDAAEPWTIARMGDRYGRLKRGIIAFRLGIDTIDARFKLGQDEAPDTFEEIVTEHPDAALAAWMRHTAQGG